MELSLQQRRKALNTKIPDIDQTLSVVKYLQIRRNKAQGIEEPKDVGDDDADEDEDEDLDDLDEEEGEAKEDKLKSLFELNDTLYAEAEVEETGEVGLWLGVSGISTRQFLSLRACGLGDTDGDRPTQCCCIPCKKL